MNLKENQSGATIIEAIIAFSLLATLSMSMMPLFQIADQASKRIDLKSECEAAVRSKLDLYRFGQVTALPATTALQHLSLPTLGGGSAGGFYFSKMRYNQYFPFSCRGQSNPDPSSTPVLTSQVLGMRECLDNTVAPWDDQAVSQTCASPVDQSIRSRLPGFKLYVKLERESPWIYGVTATDSYSDTCPDYGPSSAVRPAYDFNGDAEGIRVTVTGLLDTSESILDRITGVSNRDQFSCAVSATVFPYRYPFRYYLTQTGRIHTVHGTSVNRREETTPGSGEWVFQNIYDSNSFESNIQAFVVHPRNFSVYVLKVGSLVRYGGCSGVPINCPTSGTAGRGDNGSVDTQPVRTWSVSPSIAGIGVDFRNNRVYGFTDDYRQFYSIRASDGQEIPDCVNADNCPADGVASLEQVSLNNLLAEGGAAASSGILGRVDSFFLSLEGDVAFVTDGSTRTDDFGNPIFTKTIYRESDRQLLYPLMTLPVEAKYFSK